MPKGSTRYIYRNNTLADIEYFKRTVEQNHLKKPCPAKVIAGGGFRKALRVGKIKILCIMKKYKKPKVVAKNNPKVQYAAGCNSRDHASVSACDACRTRY